MTTRMLSRFLFRSLALCTAALCCSQPAHAAPDKKTKGSSATQAAAPAPSTHAQFPAFTQALDKMVKENSTDYYDAITCVLSATDGDETAVNAWMHEAAKKGNAAALRWELSQKLSDIDPSQLLSPNIKDAYQQLVKLADTGYVPAMIDVSACRRIGIGTAQNEESGIKMLIEACKGGDFKARFQWLMDTKRLSKWDDKDKPEVASEISRGNHYVINQLSSLAPDTTTQVEWIKNAAGKGSSDAYLTLSSLASVNHPKESLTLLRLAVHLHHPEALFILASVLVDNGEATVFQKQAEITPDTKESIRLMKTAALLGNLRAALAIGAAYYDGTNGLPQDDKKAYFHFSNPLISGRPAAKTAAALMLLLGKGVKQDTTKAFALLKKISQSFAPALIHLAWAYFNGVGTKQNSSEAAELLQEAAASGASAAYVYLAYMYTKGAKDFPADPAQAKRYVRLASFDMGDRAQQLYDALVAQGWTPHP